MPAPSGTFEPAEATPAQLVERIRQSYGMTWAEMGRQLGRSEKMLRKVAKGESSGESYRQALTELHDQGHVEHIPARRRGKDGKIVPVRAKRGAPAKVFVPQDQSGTFEKVPKRGAFKAETYFLAEGGRQDVVAMPKTKTAKGRKAGLQDLMTKIRAVAKSQRANDKRVKIEVVFETGDGRGRVTELGSKSGYHASDILSDVRTLHGGDFDDWVTHQTKDRYKDFDTTDHSMVKVTMTTYNAHRSKDERKMEDQAGTRRRNRDPRGHRIVDNVPDGNRRHRRRKSG
ncbi:MAG: hypothetical protein L0J68_11235 [Micrococcaceae bacterium]|nr:hypothetical protein [Micrococcaceae bacterium]